VAQFIGDRSSALLKVPALEVRCAWCDRVEVDGTWIVSSAATQAVGRLLTHGICSDCLAGVRAA
jgi:hypothetical protein